MEVNSIETPEHPVQTDEVVDPALVIPTPEKKKRKKSKKRPKAIGFF